jgi:polygalacturonase
MSYINIRELGAKGDGQTNDTRAFAAATRLCAEHGGGRILVPPGRYLTGSVILGDHTELHLLAGATILGSQNPDDYPVVNSQWEGRQMPTHSGLIHALGATGITLSGRGTIDGQGSYWWQRVRAADQHPRPRMIALTQCRDVRISGLTLVNSPAWTVHPLGCHNLSLCGLSIRNPHDSPNTDGINPESCQAVRISDCHIDVGDDCIAIKAGASEDGQGAYEPCQDILISNCTLCSGHGGVVIGSEMSGGVRRVAITNCIFLGTDRGIRVKSRRGRGGVVEDLRCCNLIMQDVGCPLVLHTYYRYGAIPPTQRDYVADRAPQPVDRRTPTIRNIHLANVTARNVLGPALAFIYGLPEMPIGPLTLDQVELAASSEMDPRMREPAMMVLDHAYEEGGLFATHARDLRLRGVALSPRRGPALRLQNTRGVRGDAQVCRGGAAELIDAADTQLDLRDTDGRPLACVAR